MPQGATAAKLSAVVPNLAPSEHNDKDPNIQASIPRVPEEEKERKRDRERERERERRKNEISVCVESVSDLRYIYIYVEYV